MEPSHSSDAGGEGHEIDSRGSDQQQDPDDTHHESENQPQPKDNENLVSIDILYPYHKLL